MESPESQIYALLSEGIKSRDERMDRLELLLEKSEERIASTNKMVDRLVGVISHLTDEYSRHLDALSKCRDELVQTNTNLTNEVSTLVSRISSMELSRIQSDNEWRVFLKELAMSRSSHNSINVN